MSGEMSTIQSLKAVDAWIDVINANINGGVRTSFKSARLKFSGSNVDIQHAGNATSLPLQFPESGLTTANTVIDFTQGAITASTENTHLAIQGTGFFLVVSPDAVNTTAGASFGSFNLLSASTRFYLTRDGEFRTDQNGFLRTSYGYYLVPYDDGGVPGGAPYGSNTILAGSAKAVFNDLDNPTLPTGSYYTLSEYLKNAAADTMVDNGGGVRVNSTPLVQVKLGMQSLKYSQFGSTVFDFGYRMVPAAAQGTYDSNIKLGQGTSADATILSKSLEASNASMTQSVPELSLAQKLFSALTKVLQTKQTNVDGVLNLIR